ncbi:site-specific DNA-methyltransferase [Micromonospora sp. NPDC049891]|uniref:DNA-methyltransferase n=1 Tax=Micromonospora sp. NPDC049891 TaxID=3155655 RepID=UPI00340BEF9F
MKPYYSDDSVTLHHGDALDVLRAMASGSVNCVVTSPPYYGLRDYGEPGQYGLEETPAAYVERMRDVFSEVRRVLADDGTLWLNIGDSYASTGGTSGVGPDAVVAQTRRQDTGRTRLASTLPPKNLLGIPWRVAFALQDDGWILRNRIVWHKTNAMPESVTDRLSSRSEELFLFAKAQRYWFDLDAIREPAVTADRPATLKTRGGSEWSAKAVKPGSTQQRTPGADGLGHHALGRNPGDVWLIPTAPFSGAHFAVMSPGLARRCIAAGGRPGGIVLDPFAGSCTTGMVANQLGRRFVGIDLSAKYLDLALRTRLAQGVLMFGDAA